MSTTKQTKDTISKIKQDEAKNKPQQEKQFEEDIHVGSDEEDQNQKQTGVVHEQAVSNTNKAKNLADILGSGPGIKQPSKKKPQKEKKKQSDQPPAKHQFTNSSKKGDTHWNDKGLQKPQQQQPKQETKAKYNVSGLVADAKDNEKFRPKKNYLEKDIVNEYTKESTEIIDKPEFKNWKVEGTDNFVELNQKEDLYIKNISDKKFEMKNEYNDEKEHEKRSKGNRQHYKKQEKEEIVNDLDSDGFEVIGTKAKKKSENPRTYNKNYSHKKKSWKNKNDDKKNENEKGKEEGKGEEEKDKKETKETPQKVDGAKLVVASKAKGLGDLLG